MAFLICFILVLVPLVAFFSRNLISESGVKTPKRFPPGPRALPIIGNIHQVPLIKPYLKFASWSHTYGPITGLRLGSRPVLVLNQWTAVRDLLDKRGSTYSSRLPVPIAERVTGDHHTAFQAYGAKWRRSRKTISDFLKETELEKRAMIQEAEAIQLVWDFLQEPEQYRNAVLRCFGAIILESVYGIRGQWYEGGFMKRFFDMEERWTGLLDKTQTPPLEILPWIEYIPEWLTPWRGWRKRTDDLAKLQRTLYQDLIDNTKLRLDQGIGEDCFLTKLLKGQEVDGYTDDELRGLGGVMLEGGAETTATAMQIFIMAMATHVEFQKKAQAEVDEAFGGERLPSGVPDREALPFVRACYLESTRWRPLATTAVPHLTTQDDTYAGYFIPAGTLVIMNAWGLHHDANQYEHPGNFNPVRFMQNKYGLKDGHTPFDENRKQTYVFGAGRRVCPGQKMAEDSLLSCISKILWSFDIVTKEGLDTDIRTAFKDSFVCGPKEFPIQFRVRSQRKKQSIEEAWLVADKLLKKFE